MRAKRNDRAERAEPIRLVVGRRNRKVQKRAFLVPHAVVVASDDAEAVIARREVRIFYFAVIDNFSPVAILTLQLETKTHSLGLDAGLAPCNQS